ncbi:signal peptidase I [bacterium]|nr:signal peptidase I [bacterium]
MVMILGIVYLAVLILAIVSLWKMFSKANEAGWKSIVPIYNYITLLKIVGRPWWWIIGLIIPIVQLVVLVIISLDLAKSFGKSEVFGIFGLFLFGIVGYPMLAFGSAKYVGPGGASSTPTATPAAPSAPAAPAA